jgi:DNA-binding beta-propeller fold protein YncE
MNSFCSIRGFSKPKSAAQQMKVSHNYSFLSVYLRPAITAAVLAIISSSLIELAPAKPKDTIVTTVTVAPWASGIAVTQDDTSVYVASILSP